MNTWGNKLRLSLFGESHGAAIGIVIDGLPPGETLDRKAIAAEMARRAPGNDPLSTPRREADEVEIVSGLLDDKTNGFPLCGIIRNRDMRSKDYGTALRPGHADVTALLKYGGHADMRGGGHFSGRLTAPLTFAGAVAKQLLAKRGIAVYGHIAAIAGIADESLPCSPAMYESLAAKELPIHSDDQKDRMVDAILQAKSEGDSVGGVIEAVVFGLPGGLGEPFFGSVESEISALLFSIPAVKGVEFGDGFALATLRGSESNDPLRIKDGAIISASNHNGGILGGITNGMPLTLRAAIKPTPSISRAQQTVDAATMQETTLHIKGRHDPCIVPRAVPVVEAAVALCILDLLLQRGDCVG
jgi:chorismate synthase